ncbi:MAG: hypothetical protein EZS28_040144, partial [Streblomastix strix]
DKKKTEQETSDNKKKEEDEDEDDDDDEVDEEDIVEPEIADQDNEQDGSDDEDEEIIEVVLDDGGEIKLFDTDKDKKEGEGSTDSKDKDQNILDSARSQESQQTGKRRRSSQIKFYLRRPQLQYKLHPRSYTPVDRQYDDNNIDNVIINNQNVNSPYYSPYLSHRQMFDPSLTAPQQEKLDMQQEEREEREQKRRESQERGEIIRSEETTPNPELSLYQYFMNNQNLIPALRFLQRKVLSFLGKRQMKRMKVNLQLRKRRWRKQAWEMNREIIISGLSVSELTCLRRLYIEKTGQMLNMMGQAVCNAEMERRKRVQDALMQNTLKITEYYQQMEDVMLQRTKKNNQEQKDDNKNNKGDGNPSGNDNVIAMAQREEEMKEYVVDKGDEEKERMLQLLGAFQEKLET